MCQMGFLSPPFYSPHSSPHYALCMPSTSFNSPFHLDRLTTSNHQPPRPHLGPQIETHNNPYGQCVTKHYTHHILIILQNLSPLPAQSLLLCKIYVNYWKGIYAELSVDYSISMSIECSHMYSGNFCPDVRVRVRVTRRLEWTIIKSLAFVMICQDSKWPHDGMRQNYYTFVQFSWPLTIERYVAVL